MSDPSAAHLLVIDGDERLRDLLKQYLRKQGFLVSLARDGDHARHLLTGLDFDLVILDAALPLAKALCNEVTCPVLVLTSATTQQIGAKDWMEKPFEPAALCARINNLLDRRPAPIPTGPKLITMGDLSFNTDTGLLSQQGEPVRLTRTEVQLLRIFAEHQGEAVGRGELVARLGREGLADKARAVDVQITRLRRKLEADPKNPRYLQTVRGAGYMLVSDQG
jgi:two-component system, OmpR family, phosphate regulon response regulator OmpR